MPRPEWDTARAVADAVVAMGALTMALPLLVAAGVGIALSSRGPVIYRATRVGRDRRRVPLEPHGDARPGERRRPGYRGREFTLFKLRTMHVGAAQGSPITSSHDPRVFPFGALLRATKIDELPQLLNVVRGEMALVGPRPEAPEIVRAHYRPADLETLQVRPGLTSPGSLRYFTEWEAALDGASATERYAAQLLPLKLDVDRDYLRRATLLGDWRVILQTIGAIVARVVFRRAPGNASRAASARSSTPSHQSSRPASSAGEMDARITD